jgi:hypothetical protein
MKIAVFYAPTNSRSLLVAQAMLRGIVRSGQQAQIIPSPNYRRPEHDIAIFYGLAEGLAKIFDDYKTAGRKAIYIDLGYWGRKKKSKFDGYHKLILNDRHPTEYFQSKPKPPDRFREFDIPIRPWRESKGHVVVVGMSGKGAVAEGFAPQQWEREAITRLRRLTRRPIIYRPKPTWLAARPIPGSVWMKDGTIDDVLADAYAVVAHHSNVAVEAILAGVPCICQHGVASVMSAHRLDQINDLPRPDGRLQWASDIAFTQYNLAEMQLGIAWQYLVRERLV